ncbi:hypothetical protein Ahy_Scaffold1g106760 isoform D [Arachis hypogaea]|uniref:Retrotransposon gag domain-containing protein n=1 Tax=Arachis hypogaea TaxID=3818 RepID=A0A444WS01_ARAHY|nr:hypothetical protein Ahy_Scaffold1g106760 isoform D [Arachis hypogaea]
MKFFPSSLTKNTFTWFSNLRPNSITTWNQLENAFHVQFYRGEMNVAVTDLVALKREDGETIDDYIIRFKNARSRCYVSLPESKVVKIAFMGLRFYMRQKLLNVHIPDLAHLTEKIFDVLLKDKKLILPEGRTLLSVKDLKKKPYYKFHQATSHLINSCVRFRDLIQKVIIEGHLKFDDGKKEMKVDVGPFDTDVSFVEPCFGVNIVGISYDFDVPLDNFESQVRFVYPRAGDGLLNFLVQQKIKDRNVSLYPRCNAVFDAEAAAIFKKERMKKELAHRQEQARQRQLIRRIEGQRSKTPQQNVLYL